VRHSRRVPAHPQRPPLLHRGGRGDRAAQRDRPVHVRGADAQRREPGVRRPLPLRGGAGPGVRLLRDRRGGRRGRGRAGDRHRRLPA
ncbi:MAG: NADH-ubiquinone oxidoreductase chain K, partial [uncultured Gemmatimonadetes bacterium]